MNLGLGLSLISQFGLKLGSKIVTFCCSKLCILQFEDFLLLFNSDLNFIGKVAD